MSVARTTNLSLAKPDYTEQADIDVLNDNFDAIDAAIGDLQSSSVDATEVDDEDFNVSALIRVSADLVNADEVQY